MMHNYIKILLPVAGEKDFLINKPLAPRVSFSVVFNSVCVLKGDYTIFSRILVS